MISRMRNLENAARLAMAHADMPVASASPAAPAAGLVRRILATLARLLTGH